MNKEIKKQECIPVGCVSSAAVAVCLGGVSAWERVFARGGVHNPLWTEFLTHACENITLPQLRCGTVIRKSVVLSHLHVSYIRQYDKVFPSMIQTTNDLGGWSGGGWWWIFWRCNLLCVRLEVWGWGGLGVRLTYEVRWARKHWDKNIHKNICLLGEVFKKHTSTQE